MVEVQFCPACGAQPIPGIDSCVNCGEPLSTIAFREAPGMIVPDAGDVERYKRENERAQAVARRLTEARALEYAGDVMGAIVLYEALVREGVGYGTAHKRLAIIYAKLKRLEDEERIVRLALAHVGGGASSWFVLRLAKILARKGK